MTDDKIFATNDISPIPDPQPSSDNLSPLLRKVNFSTGIFSLSLTPFRAQINVIVLIKLQLLCHRKVFSPRFQDSPVWSGWQTVLEWAFGCSKWWEGKTTIDTGNYVSIIWTFFFLQTFVKRIIWVKLYVFTLNKMYINWVIWFAWKLIASYFFPLQKRSFDWNLSL